MMLYDLEKAIRVAPSRPAALYRRTPRTLSAIAERLGVQEVGGEYRKRSYGP